MPMNENQANSKPAHRPFWGHRQQVFAMIVAHLTLTCVTSAASFWLEFHILDLQIRNDLQPEYLRLLFAATLGFQIGQIALLASWGAFAAQHWLLRISRFLALTAWSIFLYFLGQYLINGGWATLLVEEEFAYALILMFVPVVILFSYRAMTGRRFVHCDSDRGASAWQFSTRHLLLFTAEAAALLAVGRIVIPWNFSTEEFWTALIGYRTEELILAVVSVTVLPVVFFALARQRTRQRCLAIGLYLLLPSLVLAWVQESYRIYMYGPAPPGNWWPELAMAFCDNFCVHLSAAATILFTFYLLRRIGYDFRRRDEEPPGRSSSNARNSAASASA